MKAFGIGIGVVALLGIGAAVLGILGEKGYCPPADPKADGLASCYAATCWSRGLMRAVSPWT